ncbi:MAG: ScpA family protein [Phycisphaerales bacterium]
MPLDDVRIQLDAFEGPLDLLLFLIRRDEVDIADIPISRLTEQYMATLAAAGMEHIDIETAGEFLVMAATLMEIKSRMLMPAPAVGAEGDSATGETDAGEPAPGVDPRADLVRQLLAYKKYRDAARALDQRLGEWDHRFPGGGAGVPEAPARAEDDDAAVELGEVDIVDLTRAFASIMETVDLSRVGEHHVTDDETPIALHATDILDRLSRLDGAGSPDGSATTAPPELEFREIFAGRTRAEAIGLFLALLELVRERRVEALQDRINGRIVLRRSERAADQG